MSRSERFLLRFVCLLSLLALAPAHGGAEPIRPDPGKPNVLLIAVDDLNDWVGALNGHPDTSTPNIDRLAARGMLFTNAHAQAPICNPSRTSLMFGMRPSTTGFYDNEPNGARSRPLTENYVSLPRHFAANGYKTLTTGKIYHASQLPEGDFEVVGPRPGQWIDLDQPVQVDRPDHMHWLWDFGPQSYDEGKFADYTDASWAIERLEEEHDRPFFLALGFYRPHVPFFPPERLYNHPDLSGELRLPLVKPGDLDDISEHAKKITYSPHPASQDWVEQNGNEKWYEAMRSYLACIRWTDEQIGRTESDLATHVAERQQQAAAIGNMERTIEERRERLAREESEQVGTRRAVEALREKSGEAALARARAEGDRRHLDDLCRQELGMVASDAEGAEPEQEEEPTEEPEEEKGEH